MGMVSVVLGLAYVARWEDRHEDAVRLAGAAESLRERVGGGAPVNFLAGFMGDPEAEARAHLSPEAAQWAIQEGRTMSVDAAVALAVGQDATTDAPAGSGMGSAGAPGST